MSCRLCGDSGWRPALDEGGNQIAGVKAPCEHPREAREKITEFVDFKILRMPCCGQVLCWVNPRYPTYCPECGKMVYPGIRDPRHQVLRDEAARLVVGRALTRQEAT